MSAGSDSLRSILFALGANFLIAVAKTAGAVFTGSSSMLAEAIHSYADCANQGSAALGPARGPAPAERGPSARLRQGDLLLELHRRPDAVQHGRHVLDLRRRAQVARAAADRERLGRGRHPRLRHRRRERVALGLPARGQQGARRGKGCGAGSAPRARASCWSCSPRTSPRSAAWRWRWLHRASRSRPATRRGTPRARSASARCWCWSRCWSASRSRRC